MAEVFPTAKHNLQLDDYELVNLHRALEVIMSHEDGKIVKAGSLHTGDWTGQIKHAIEAQAKATGLTPNPIFGLDCRDRA